jgi:uroporphyrinogen III methyltransferase/synthase
VCVAFSSENGVEAFFTEIARQGLDARAFGSAKVAAIGPGTADALLRHGIRTDLLPTRHVGEALADAIETTLGESLRGAHVLLPRAAAARDALPQRLRDAGAIVDDVPAYRTLGPAPDFGAALRARIEGGELDAITFTSASTVEHTAAALGEGAASLLARLTVASIGPITTEAAARLSVRVDATAEPHTVQGLVDALTRAFAVDQKEKS